MSTTKNLETAFAGESQANRKYTAFARKAASDGYPNLARLFRAVAAAETVHALSHFRALGGSRSTVENLQAAIAGEAYEIRDMYPPFLAEARDEGNKPAAESFRMALEVEKVHHELYGKALEAVKAGKDVAETSIYVCEVCGHTHLGEPPDKCPVCGAPKQRYSVVE